MTVNPHFSPSRSDEKPRRWPYVILLILLGAALVLGGGAFFAIRWVDRWSTASVSLPSPAEVELPRGGGLESLSRSLVAAGLVSDWRLFYGWVRWRGKFERFQAGNYRFETSVSPSEIAGAMMRGETYTPVVFQVTVPEGESLREIAETLAAGGVGGLEEIVSTARDHTFLKRLNVPGESLEGFLSPATYPFTVLPSAEEAFSVMVERFWRVLPSDYEERVNAMGLSLQQAVTFASLIELETARDEERALVSEVIWNRLKRGQSLGIDAAIIYGIKDYAGDITWKHLKDESNPYNTRLRVGLPPTPIASPSLKSLLAVLEPAHFGFMYYVADPHVPNTHRFARTLSEHNKNVREYVKARRAIGAAR